MISKETKKRFEGVADLTKTVVTKNPVAHAIMTAKEIGDAAFKIKYGKDPRYAKLLKRYSPTPKKKPYSASKAFQWERYLDKRQKIFLEEDPLKRAYRAARALGDYESARIMRRLMR